MASDGPVMRWNQVEYSAGDERLMSSALLMPSGTGAFSARSGRRPGGLGATVSGTTVTIQPGAGVVYDAAYASAGPWLFALPALKTIPLGARPGSGQSRIDLIVARIYDPDSGLGSARELKIERVAGTASPTPSAPSLPAMSLEIARATVPATGNVSLTLSSARTVAAGGILPVATVAERDALPSPAAGLAVYVEATGELCIHDGTGWKRWTPSQDTDWATLQLGTSQFNVPNWANAPAWCISGGNFQMRGVANRISGNLAVDLTPVRIPEPYWPDKQLHFTTAGQSGSSVRIRVAARTDPTPGWIVIHATPAGSPSWVGFDSIIWKP